MTMTREEYEKVVKTRFYFTRTTPKNWVSGRPVRVFGYVIGYIWRIALPGYPWSNANKYNDYEPTK